MAARLTLAACVAALVVVAAPRVAEAALVYTNPADVTVAPGRTVPIAVHLSSAGETINVLEAVLLYPTDLLDVVSVNRAGSFLSLWAEEPTVDAEAGRVSFVGGIQNGSVVHNAPALEVVFRAKRTGRADLRFDPFHSSVYLNDGAGTQTALTIDGTTVTIANADPFLPVITSPTHPYEWAWSSQRLAVLRWDAYPGSFYSYHLRRDPNEEPDDIADQPRSEATYQELVDGVWSFALRQRLPHEDWGPPVRRRLLIDATPPEPFQPVLVHDTGQTLVSFATRDVTSGIDRYEARVLRSRFSWFPFFFRGAWEPAVSPLNLTAAGTYQSVAIRAVDAAGNAREATAVNPDLVSQQQRFFVAVAVAVLVLLLAVAVLVHARRGAQRTTNSLKQ